MRKRLQFFLLNIPSFNLFVQKKEYIADMPNGKLSFFTEFCLLYALKTTGFAERKQVFCDHKCLPKAELGNKAKVRVEFC